MNRTKKRCNRGYEEREDKIRRLTELIQKNEYIIDPELLADAILRHLGMADREALSSRKKGAP
jgi:hypothetical protein